MEWYEVVAVLVAGVWAGAINAVVGSGTLVTFPTLLALGIPPVGATMTNAIGICVGSISAAWGYRRELVGQGRRLALLLPASLLGATGGAWLLLNLPESAFESIVPVLLALALVLVLVQPRLQRRLRQRTATGVAPARLSRRRVALLVGGTFVVGVYGGYFAAVQGIILIGVLGALLVDDLQRLNAVRNVLTAAVNIVAALVYTTVGGDRVVWPVVGLLAVSSVVGGLLGARFGRRLPATALRVVILAIGATALVLLVVP